MDANLITLYQNILETQGIQFLLLSQSDAGWEYSDICVTDGEIQGTRVCGNAFLT